MADVSIRGMNQLQDRMQKAQDSLKDVDENLKKLTGRTGADMFRRFPGRGRGGGGPLRGDRNSDRGRARLFNMARQSIGGATADERSSRGLRGSERTGRVGLSSVDRRRSAGARFTGASDDEDFGRPTTTSGLSSHVIYSNVEIPSREQSITKTKQDKKGMARNKRMFGLLLGTLQKFKDDTSQVSQNNKYNEIEEKLEKKAREEKDEMIRKKNDLLTERHKKTRELRRLEAKLALVENHQIWETETLKLKHFIRTDTKPYVFWMPKDHVPETLRKHASTKKSIDDLISKRKAEMENDVEAILKEAEKEDMDNSRNEQNDSRSHDDDQHRNRRDYDADMNQDKENKIVTTESLPEDFQVVDELQPEPVNDDDDDDVDDKSMLDKTLEIGSESMNSSETKATVKPDNETVIKSESHQTSDTPMETEVN